MRPKNLNTRIFLDSGDPKETAAALKLLGFLDGQTTNPSLIAKNPEAQGKKFQTQEVYNFYRQVVRRVSSLIPQGSTSIEVYADKNTKAEAMLKQGREFYSWIPNAHIKFPATTGGLKAAAAAVKQGLRVNMTLVFSQEQAAAVYAATQGAKKGQVYISPFIGRLDDIGQNGMDVIANIIKMYSQGDGHVEVLTASVRSLDHLLEAFRLGSDIVTAPLKILQDWADKGLPMPDENFVYHPQLKPIPYQDIKLNKAWQEYNLQHDLTDKGLEKFSADWNALIL